MQGEITKKEWNREDENPKFRKWREQCRYFLYITQIHIEFLFVNLRHAVELANPNSESMKRTFSTFLQRGYEHTKANSIINNVKPY